MSARPDPRPVLSLVLGLLSVGLLLNLITGAPAVFLGLRTMRAGAQGRQRSLAGAGVVLGSLGCLLGVAGIIALIVVAMREKANRTQCANNLRQIGHSISLYYNAKKSFPTAAISSPLPPEQRLSWYVSILPYLEMQSISSTGAKRRAEELANVIAGLRPEQPWNSPDNATAREHRMLVLLCPGHPATSLPGDTALTNYIGSAGLGANAITIPKESTQAGLFGYDRQLTRDDLNAGESYTLAALETTSENGPWLAAGRPTARGVVESEVPLSGPDRPFGGCHPGGLNVLLVDGGVRFFVNTNDVPAWVRLVPIHRSE